MSELEIARRHFLKALESIDANEFGKAELRLLDALVLLPNNASILTNLSIVSLRLNKTSAARRYAEEAISLKSKDAEALSVLAHCCIQSGEFTKALACYDSLVSLDPTIAQAHNNRGVALAKLGRLEEALDSYDNALALKPDLSDAFVNRGNALRHLKRYVEAIESYEGATSLQPGLPSALLGRGNVFLELKKYTEAASAYSEALVLRPDLVEAWIGQGNLLVKLHQYPQALAAYDRALGINPNLTSAWLGRGSVLLELKRHTEAIADHHRALALEPQLAEGHFGLGNIYLELKRYDKALAAYDEAIALKPDLAELAGTRLHVKMHLCDWRNFDAECGGLLAALRDGTLVLPPFSALNLPFSAQDQLQCAKVFVAERLRDPENVEWRSRPHNHDRIRIAYLSADFHRHATSYLMAGVFEHHDKSGFELIGLSFGPVTRDDMQRRVETAFEKFIYVQDRTDEEVASLARSLEVDIAVDLKGFTEFNRAAIFARRAASVQVNYLGYPGTMGASFMDYIIADAIVIPLQDQDCYAESVIYMPNSYQANDLRRVISDRKYTRAQAGLPETGFVFCCFNNNYKITSDVFAAWSRILKAVESSVLWLIESNQVAVDNLRKEASRNGVSPERLVFAKRISLPDHLARHHLADLFLDTLPCTAHTTASDSLWAGVPVLTRIGKTFAGRVAASLLNAIELSEMITETAEAYEKLAIDLATNPLALTAIRSKLADKRRSAPLFDTNLFTRHLESAYRAIYDRHQAGLPPVSICVPRTM